MCIAVLLVVVIIFLFISFPLIQVVGDSMYPTYFNGDLHIGTRLFRRNKIKVGDVVLYRYNKDKVVIKRVSDIRIDNNGLSFYFLGDNLECSYDSRNYGYISSKKVICKLLNQRTKVNL